MVSTRPQITRRITIKTNPSEMTERETDHAQVKQVSGTITVDIWDGTLSVIDLPSETQHMSFYLQPGVFGMGMVDNQPMPRLTDYEKEYIRSVVEGYLEGTTDNGASIYMWSVGLYVAYQIVERYSYAPLTDKNGHLAVYDSKESAQNALDKLDSDEYKIRTIHMSGS